VRQPGSLRGLGAEALDLRAEPAQRGEGALEVRALLLGRLRERRVVRVRVVPDLVARLEDRLDRPRVALRRPAGDEERRRQPVLAQQLEDPRHADERPVGLVRHDAEVVRVEAALREDRRLRVDVEGQARLDRHASARRESSS
jgi:hypothetical protein